MGLLPLLPDALRPAVGDFNADIQASLAAIYRSGNPDSVGKVYRSAIITRNGGWFGSAHRAPTVRPDLALWPTADFDALVEAFRVTGFRPGNSWHLNDSANISCAHAAPDGGRLRQPLLGRQIGMSNASRGFASDADLLQTDFNSLLWRMNEGSYYGGLFAPGSKASDRLDGKMFTGPFVDGRYQPTAQAALFASYAAVVPDERVPQVRHWLLEHLNEVKGPMSHYYLFQALYAMEDEKQDRLVLERMHAGWKPQVESPWQKRWKDPDNGGSKAHMYGVVPGYFLSAHVLGARRQGHVADHSILIEPRCGELAWVQGVAVTEFGPVKMSWSNLDGGGIKIQCTVPANTTANLRIYKRGSGDRISVDGQVRTGTLNGNFLETALGPGTHEAQYPA